MMSRLLGACALAATTTLTPPGTAAAQTLRLAEGTVETALRVPLNRAVVLESDQPFAELSVANPEIADIATLSSTSIYVLGRAPGGTTLTLLGENGTLIANIEVRVTPDIAEFKERLRELLPGETIGVQTANDGLVLSGTVSSIRALENALQIAERYAPERVLNMMNVGGEQQVQLRVTFAEVSRSAARQLDGALTANGSAFGDDLVFGAETRATLTDGTREGLATLAIPGSNFNLTAALAALESKGLSRTLARPNLAALSGQPARFLAGGEFPIPVFDSTGDDGDEPTIAIEFRPFGVELIFTPTVVGDGIINLQLDAAVSEIDSDNGIEFRNVQINAFARRQATTTVELRDGQSFAIGGLLQDDFRDNASGVPWLADIPVLGALFRSTEYQRNQSELMIVVEAHLIRPTRPEAIPLPTDSVRLPSERDLFLDGDLDAPVRAPIGTVVRAGRDGDPMTDDLSGTYGYVLE